MATTAGPNRGEAGMKFSKQELSCYLEIITKQLDGKVGLCEEHHFPSYMEKFKMIIGPKLNRVNRRLDV